MSGATLWHAQGGALVRKGRLSKGSGLPDDPGGGGNPPPPPPPPPNERFPGDPNPKVRGRTYFGAGIQASLGTPTSRHDVPSGSTMGIWRRFYSELDDIATPNGALLQAVRECHAAGRLPWVSFKLPNWKTAQSGGYDAQLNALIAELNKYAKPVYLSCSHEPENDWKSVYGDGATAAQKSAWRAEWAPAYRGMQQRIRQRLDAWIAANPTKRNRIALGGILMSWTWNPASGDSANNWWPGANVWHFFGVDHYTEPSQQVHRTTPWEAFVSYTEAKGIPFAIGEWGLRREDTAGASKMQGFWNRMLDGTHDCVGLTYFDSNQNSTSTGWSLDNSHGLLNKFHDIMADPRVLHMSDLGY